MPFEQLSPLPELTRPIRVPISNFARYEEKLGRALRQAAFAKSLRPAGKLVRLFLEEETIRREIFWRKKFARAWRLQPTNLSSAVRIVNKTPYGRVLEYGRRPNRRPPPVKALVPWVRDRWGLRGKDAKSAAFALSRLIGKRGMPSKNTPWKRRVPMTTRKTVQDKIVRIVATATINKMREELARQ